MLIPSKIPIQEMAERNRTGRFDSILLFHPLLPRLAWTKPKIGSFKLLLLLLLLLVIEPPTAQGTNEASNQFGSIEALPWSSLCLSFFLFLFLRIGLFPLDKLLIESASFVLPPPETEINFFHPVLLIINGFERFIVLFRNDITDDKIVSNSKTRIPFLNSAFKISREKFVQTRFFTFSSWKGSNICKLPSH